MEKRIITISREFGSGGRTIGKLVAEHLGIRCYDAELIQKLAVESGFDENYVKEAGEYTPGGFLASAFTDRSFGPTNEDLLWKLQYRIIRELAEKEPCVIVGRCADFILQDRTDCLKVFVHADMKFRADRIVRVYTLIALVIVIALSIALEIFLSEYLLYHYDNDEQFDESEE